MRRHLPLWPLVLFALLFALPGCPIRTSQGNQLEVQMAEMQQRNDALERDLHDLQTRFDASSEVAGEAVAGFSQIEQEVAILQGKVDELAHTKPEDASPEKIAALRRELAAEFARADKRLAALEKKANVKNEAGDFSTFGEAAVVVPPVDGGDGPGDGIGALPGEGNSQKSEADLYRDGVALFKQGNLEASKSRFREFLRRFPKSKQCADAQYYVAESLFKQRAWEESILEFDTLVSKYPQSKYVPVAYLHMGIAFEENGQSADARLFFEKVLQQFPRSAEARIARKKLDALR